LRQREQTRRFAFHVQEADMTSNKSDSPSGSRPDDLIRSESVKLTEEELGNVSGGTQFIKYDGIKGESQDDSHKGSIEISSLKHP
jgi:hypothetical protein